jgi:inner membrane protein
LIVERDGHAPGGRGQPGPATISIRSKARLIQGEPLRVVAERVDMAGRTLARVAQPHRSELALTSCWGRWRSRTGRGSALAGRLDSVDRYDPASYRGGVLSLHYARAQELQPWLDRVAVRGEVVVQFWLKLGETAVVFEVGNEPPVDPIPKELRVFL